MEKYGFVYMWHDRKRKMFYIGSHWGSVDDGYICSSNRMRKAYKRRPEDFKRRILATTTTNRSDLLDLEYRYLSLISDEELGCKYYNLTNHRNGHWAENEYSKKTLREKISSRTKEAMQRPDVRKNYERGIANRDHKQDTAEVRAKKSASMKETMAKKYPVENRKVRLDIDSEELKELHRVNSTQMWETWSEDKKRERSEKISKSLKGKQNRLGQKNSATQNENISNALKGKIHKRHKITIDGVEYKSSTEASKAIGVSRATINRRLNSDRYPKYIRLGNK